MDRTPSTILVPVEDPRQAAAPLALAHALLGQHGGKVIALGIVSLPADSSPTEGMQLARAQRKLLREVGRLGEAPGVQVKTLVRVAPDPWEVIREVVAQEDVDLLLLAWKGGASPRSRVLGGSMYQALHAPPCDTVLVRPGTRQDPPQSIFLPLRGGPSAELAVRLAAAIARESGATLTLMHVDRSDALPAERVQESLQFGDLATHLGRDLRVRRVSVTAPSIAEVIASESQHHDVVMMGAPLAGEGPGQMAAVPEVVAARSGAQVLVVKSRTPVDQAQFRPRPASVSTLVDRWFAEQSFHAREFSDLEELIALKQRQGLTVGLGIPTHNDASTIGTILRVLRWELMERYPLLDELAVLDLGSQDETLDIVREHGIPAFRMAEVLPEFGGRPGRGDALWKSQLVLKSDILAWVEADIKNIHPKFVYGVVGPLLRHEDLVYVKGFYRTPIRVGNLSHQTGGGRLTELLARPLLNLFFPELSGFIYPLSREHAIRRSVLERLPVFSGDGTELALLLDVLHTYGLHALGQSELEERIQRAQPLAFLGQRALAVLHAFMTRLEARGKARVLVDPQATMKLILQSEGQFSLEEQVLEQVERPPMISVPAYLEQRAQIAAAHRQTALAALFG
ncbi:MAG: glucosyl-3-phosphoglycerate synthase [Chloroflexi bacterium]|nr:glucosyl-3-phosphoglycerate synthase [Chloroflexota bacterium]